jgi:hypothetical protein
MNLSRRSLRSPAQTGCGEDIVAKRRSLREPGLTGWAASTHEAEAPAARLKQSHQPVMGPVPGSRKRAEGRLLEWRPAAVSTERCSIVPFFIQWAPGAGVTVTPKGLVRL